MAPGAHLIAVVTVILSACFWSARSGPDIIPGLGCDACLISRAEIIPCQPSSAIPVNHFREFTTDYAISLTPTCEALPNGPSQSINFVGSALDRIYSFSSPGFTTTDSSIYSPSRLVEYNFRCPGNRLAYINLNNINLQEPSCFDPVVSGVTVCVDYFRLMSSAGFGFTESCGTDPSANTDLLDNGSFRAIFRTTPLGDDITSLPEDRVGGFEGTVVCFESDVNDEPGCTQVDTNARRKRNIDTSSRRRKPAAGFSPKRLIDQGFQSIRVPNGAGITFCDGVLSFTDNRDNVSSISRLPDIHYIIYFKDFDGLNDPRTFVLTAREGGDLIRFPGPGLLFYKDGFAYFQRYIVDPQLLPTEEERVVILQLTTAVQDIFRNTTTTAPPPTTPPPPRTNATEPLPTTAPPTRSTTTKKRRQRRSVTPQPPQHSREDESDSELQAKHQRERRQAGVSFSLDVLMLACLNRDACNPTLRASALAIIASSDQSCSDIGL